MAAPFDADFEAADDLFTEAFGGTVEIERHGSPPTAATAEVIVRDYQVTDEDTGLPMTVQSRDYLISISAYVVGGQAVEPQKGDVIRETVSGKSCKFTVSPIEKRPCAEWADPGGSRWLIHTNRTA